MSKKKATRIHFIILVIGTLLYLYNCPNLVHYSSTMEGGRKYTVPSMGVENLAFLLKITGIISHLLFWYWDTHSFGFHSFLNSPDNGKSCWNVAGVFCGGKV